MDREIVDYNPNEHTVTNLDQLAKGTGCPYLLAIASPYPGQFIAKRWLRTLPASSSRIEVILRFGNDRLR